MHEILRHLAPGSRVLDLGSAQGSFDASAFPLVRTVRADLERPRAEPAKPFLLADAARLPFAAGAFDAVVCNHSLEHFVDLDAALDEIGRVLKSGGAFFASVPDSSTFADRVYRKISLEEGGHVNAFVSAEALIEKIEAATGLRCCGRRLLFASLSFLNSRNGVAPRPLREIGVDQEGFLDFFTWLLRRIDWFLGTRTSVYGWALYFGTIGETIDEHAWANVCVRCGSAHESGYLRARKLVTGWWIGQQYECPVCSAVNLFTEDGSMGRVR